MRVNDDERATSEPTDGASLARAAEDVCTRSFSGTPTTQPELCLDWACGPDVSGRWDDPKRLKIFAYISKFIHRETLRGGPRKAILHARKKDSDEIGAVCVVHLLHGNAQPYGSTLSVVWNMVCRHGLPPFGDVAGCQKRFEAADKLTNAMHKRHGSKSGLRHVYVAMMAVDPSAQGQKLCSKLMRTVSKVADAKGLPCYPRVQRRKEPRGVSTVRVRSRRTMQREGPGRRSWLRRVLRDGPEVDKVGLTSARESTRVAERVLLDVLSYV